MSERRFITIKQFMEEMKIGKTKAYAIVKLPGFPAVQIGGGWRIDALKACEWFEAVSKTADKTV